MIGQLGHLIGMSHRDKPPLNLGVYTMPHLGNTCLQRVEEHLGPYGPVWQLYLLARIDHPDMKEPVVPCVLELSKRNPALQQEQLFLMLMRDNNYPYHCCMFRLAQSTHNVQFLELVENLNAPCVCGWYPDHGHTTG